MQSYLQPLDTSPEALATSAIAEVGHGGHFFGTSHTIERYETAFYTPLISNWDNYPNWLERGSSDARQRANAVWKQMLAEHEDPAIGLDVLEELERYVARRKDEGGAPMN